MKKVVLLSGGVDSTTCLGLALEDCSPNDVLAINMFYGQKHYREMESARKVAKHYNVELVELDLSKIFEKSNCPLLAHSTQNIEYGSYAEQIRKTEGQKPVSTYVPFRNGLMLSAAASIAISVGATSVWYGAHADDAAGNAYPDCSESFCDDINKAIYEGSGKQVVVIAPFIRSTKAQVIKEGLRISVPYELTWSCYEGGDKPCGRCGTCIDRHKAFLENGVVDPLEI